MHKPKSRERRLRLTRVSLIVITIAFFLPSTVLSQAGENTHPRGAKKEEEVIYHEGDLVIEGNESLKLLNNYYFIDGNIIIRNNGRLKIKDATVEINNRHKGDKAVILRDNSYLYVENSRLEDRHEEISNGPALGIFFNDNSTGKILNTYSEWWPNLQGGGRVEIINSDLWYVLYNAPNGVMFVQDSRIRRYFHIRPFHGGDIGRTKLSGLEKGHVKSLKVYPLAGGFLKVEDTEVDFGWVVDVEEVKEGSVTLQLSDSTVWEIWLTFSHSNNVAIKNLQARFHQKWDSKDYISGDKLSFRLLLKNVKVIGGWKPRFHHCRAMVSNADLQTIDTRGEVYLTVENSTINFYHSVGVKKAIFKNSSIRKRLVFIRKRAVPKYGEFNLVKFQNSYIDADLIELGSSYVELKGTVQIRTPLESVNFINSTLQREFSLKVINRKKQPVSQAKAKVLNESGKIIWEGFTGKNGKATFEISFTDNNYNQAYFLRVQTEDQEKARKVSMVTSTPLLIQF